jgi:ankyrin repeat protein
MCLLLLDAGVLLDGLSPRVLMGLVKSVAVFERLLARGVNFNAMRDENGRSLCHYVATDVDREEDFRSLVSFCGGDRLGDVTRSGATPLHDVAASFIIHVFPLRVLVEMGADIDKQDNDGWTALSTVIASGWRALQRVELLLALGADTNLVTNYGKSACHLAIFHGRSVQLRALVAAGGDLDLPDKQGETPRTIAIRKEVHLPTADEIVVARRHIAKIRLDLVRRRAFQICVGLQSLNLDALQLCEILMHSFGALGSLIAFHQWWTIATKVKHFPRSLCS